MDKVKICFEKRLFDIIIGFFSILLFVPFILIILLAIFLEGIFISSSRGRFFYSEIRISLGEPFKIYKFRIFKEKSLKEALRLSKKDVIHTKELERDKNNLTYVGRFLTRVYLDEIPQLFNVLKGDISLVGPRPTNVENYERLILDGDFSKCLIKAGITGYFQSHKGLLFNKSQKDSDMEYIDFCRKNPGWKIILYDVKILLITIKTVLRAEGI